MTEPAISQLTAFLCAVTFTGLFVAPFYISPTLRTSPLQSRNSPISIKARTRAVALSCLASTLITVSVLYFYGNAAPIEILRLTGLWPIDPFDYPRVLLLVTILFIGPLYESVIVDSGWRSCSWTTFRETFFDSWTGYRNNFVAPITEEWVFRSLVISLYLHAGVSPVRIVFITPLIFGIAHIHHLTEFAQSRTPPGKRLPPANVLMVAMLRSVFQFTYTSLFGFFAAFVFLRTGSVFAAIVVHSFCNWMGFPRVSGKVGQFAYGQIPPATPDVAQGKAVHSANNSLTDSYGRHGVEAVQVGPVNLGMQWTIAYYALLVVGAFGFYKLLWPLTASSNALAML